MVQTIHFNNWLYKHLGLARVLLLLILFAAVAQYASFALIQAHMISFYGAQSEDISFALQIAYAGIIVTLPIQFRMVRFFNTQNYMLMAFLTGIVLNLGCLMTDDVIVFVILRFFIGMITCVIGGCTLMSIFSTLPEAKRMIVGISLFFSLVLACSVIVGMGTSWIVLRADVTAIYYGLIGLQVGALVLCMIVFKPASHVRPYPLFQIDWFGSALLMFGASAVAFVMIYGNKQYWMADDTLRYAAIFACGIVGMFLLRQSLVKRPLIDLKAFKTGKFLFALFLMVMFWGIKDSVNLIYGYSSAVLGWSPTDIVTSGLYNTAGVVLATIISVKVILTEKTNVPKLLLAGFTTMLVYHVWIYLNITPDLSFVDLCIPLFLHGFACGLLFVPILLFCVASLPQQMALSGIIICAYARFIGSLNSMAGFSTLQLNYNQLYKDNLLAKLISGNDNFLQRQDLYKNVIGSKGYFSMEAQGISNALMMKSSVIQSQLLTIKAIFLLAAIITGVLLIVLILFAVVSKLRNERH